MNSNFDDLNKALSANRQIFLIYICLLHYVGCYRVRVVVIDMVIADE